MAISYDTSASANFSGTVSTSPTVTNFSHNNTGNYLIVYFLTYTGANLTAKSATFNGVSMTDQGNNVFTLANPAIGNYTVSVSTTFDTSWAGSEIVYISGSWKNVASMTGPVFAGGTNTATQTSALTSTGAWHVGAAYALNTLSNGVPVSGNTTLRSSANIGGAPKYSIGIIDSNGLDTYPGNQSLTVATTSGVNGCGILGMMLNPTTSAQSGGAFFFIE